MTSATQTAPVSHAVTTPLAGIQMPFGFTSDFTDRMLQFHTAQLEALTTWQQLMNDFTQELWDEWTARWGGGVPLDA